MSWDIPTTKSRMHSSRGSRRPRCRKLQADDSAVTEMVLEQLFHATDDVRRSTILHKHTVVLSHRLAWRAEITDYSNNEEYRWPVTVHVTLSVVWNKCTIAISVFSVLSDNGPLKSNTAFPAILLIPLILYSSDSHGVLTDTSSNTVIW